MTDRDGLQMRGRLIVTAMYRRFLSPGLQQVDPDDPFFPLEPPTPITTPTNVPFRPPAARFAALLRF